MNRVALLGLVSLLVVLCGCSAIRGTRSPTCFSAGREFSAQRDGGVVMSFRVLAVEDGWLSLNDACVGVGHHRACLGGAMTDSQNVRPPS